MHVIAAAPGGSADMPPAGSSITGAPKAVPLHKGLQKVNRVAVLLPPVLRQGSAGPGQQMTGQIGHAHPGQDQKARVVAQQPEVALPGLPIPPDKGVTALCFPGSRSKQHTAQRMACLIPDQVLEVSPTQLRWPR